MADLSLYNGPVQFDGDVTVGGPATFNGNVKLQGNSGTAPGAGITDGSNTICKVSVLREGSLITTRIVVDMTDLESVTGDEKVIGTGTGPAFLTKITTAVNGTIYGGICNVIESLATGQTNIDLKSSASAVAAKGDAASGGDGFTELFAGGGALNNTNNSYKTFSEVTADHHLYLVTGASGTADTYSAGKFVITLLGTA